MSGWVLELMRTLGYLGLFLVLVVENVFPPIPSELVLPLAGFLVGLGEMNFWGAVAASTFGALVGAWILYAMGRFGGRRLVLRYGHFLKVDDTSLDRAEGWFKKYGDGVVLVARIIPVARSIVSIPAGTARMPILRFTLLTIVGTGAWNILLIYAGQLLGENYEKVSNWASAYSDVVVVIIALLVAGFVTYKLVQWRRERVQDRKPRS